MKNPPASRATVLPSITNRKQFKCWIILQLAQRGIPLSPDPSYRELQLALEPILKLGN